MARKCNLVPLPLAAVVVLGPVELVVQELLITALLAVVAVLDNAGWALPPLIMPVAAEEQ
jgi:hypothetical protein